MKDILDLKDRKILYELEQDGRQSLKKLGKKVGLKTETVFHRIKNLEKNGIIKKYLTEIDIYKLGYQFYPVLIKFQNTNRKTESEIYLYLQNHKYMAWLTRCEGAWDINLTLITKSNNEVKGFFKEFLEKYADYISDKQLFITTEIHYFKRGFWLEKPTTSVVSTGGVHSIDISSKELQILKTLSMEARKSHIDIGKLIGENYRNVAYKIKKLEKVGIIQGSRIHVDFSKIGYKFYKVWFSLESISDKNSKKMFYYFQNHSNIIWATSVIGYYDLSIEMEVKDVEEFRGILDDIKDTFGDFIKKHESLLIFEEGVMNYLPTP